MSTDRCSKARRDEFGRTPCNPEWGIIAQYWRADIDAWVRLPERRAMEVYRCPDPSAPRERRVIEVYPDPSAQRDEFGRTPCNPEWGLAQCLRACWRADIDAWVLYDK